MNSAQVPHEVVLVAEASPVEVALVRGAIDGDRSGDEVVVATAEEVQPFVLMRVDGHDRVDPRPARLRRGTTARGSRRGRRGLLGSRSGDEREEPEGGDASRHASTLRAGAASHKP